jgi:murein DD-endopeptidase MepM/ murein hydrolase activator NlpD
MKVFAWTLFFFLLYVPGVSAKITLTPAVIEDGGVTLLQWEGPPPAAAIARFTGRVIHLTPNATGASGLLGIDLHHPSGEFPIEIAVIDHHGQTFRYQAVLQVLAAERPVQRLTLPPEMVTPRQPDILKRIEAERKQLTEIFSRHSGPRQWDVFTLPVDDPVGSIFGLRRVLNGEPRAPHSGVDFRSPRGTPVRAGARGTAVLSADLYYTGRTVVLDHGEGLFSVYAHLEELLCGAGDLLERGDVLGRVGSTGRSTGPHLHWGIRLRGDRVDPLALVRIFSDQLLDSRESRADN